MDDGPVAPPAGAWIETAEPSPLKAWSLSPLPRGRGSKRQGIEHGLDRRCRPSRGGVDRNGVTVEEVRSEASRPSRGGVDRNYGVVGQAAGSEVAPPAGAWIETSCSLLSSWS